MSASPTPAERLALKTANAAILNSPDASVDIVATIVFALGAAGLLIDPETAAELAELRKLPTELDGVCLSLWEEEQAVKRAGLAYASACRRAARLRDQVVELEAELFAEESQHRFTLEQRNAHARELRELRARVAELEAAAEVLPLVTALEIPRAESHRLPLLLQRVYGHADRWFISDREGRRWHRLHGWVCEPGGLTAEEHLRDAARFTLTEAVPTARLIAEDEGVARTEGVSPQVRKLRGLLARQRAAVEDPHDSPLHHDYRTPRDLPEVTP